MQKAAITGKNSQATTLQLFDGTNKNAQSGGKKKCPEWESKLFSSIQDLA